MIDEILQRFVDLRIRGIVSLSKLQQRRVSGELVAEPCDLEERPHASPEREQRGGRKARMTYGRNNRKQLELPSDIDGLRFGIGRSGYAVKGERGREEMSIFVDSRRLENSAGTYEFGPGVSLMSLVSVGRCDIVDEARYWLRKSKNVTFPRVFDNVRLSKITQLSTTRRREIRREGATRDRLQLDSSLLQLIFQPLDVALLLQSQSVYHRLHPLVST